MRKIFYLIVILFIPLLALILRAEEAPPSLAAAVQDYVENKGVREHATFRYALTDLDDGLSDAIVLLSGHEWCGSGGCTMLVFHGTKEGFTFLSGSTITSAPIRVLPEKAHGWRTLIVFSKGKGDVLMRFDGRRYPLNPSMQPKATAGQVSAAKVVMDAITSR